VDQESLQDRFAPQSTCFGCGPANVDGLRIKSCVQVDETVAEWRAQPQHEAFPGVLNGGIVGALLDCHSNWTAAWAFMRRRGADRPPATVTADLAIRFLRPTPTDGPIRLHAHVVTIDDDRATIESSLEAGGRTCATAAATFVAVKPGHPAYGRW
jgi:acyl-coenzyme A thioesterase PaaI-like protein